MTNSTIFKHTPKTLSDIFQDSYGHGKTWSMIELLEKTGIPRKTLESEYLTRANGFALHGGRWAFSVLLRDWAATEQ